MAQLGVEAMMSSCPGWKYFRTWVVLPLQRNVTDTCTGRAWGTDALSILSFQLHFSEYGDMLRSVSLLLSKICNFSLGDLHHGMVMIVILLIAKLY